MHENALAARRVLGELADRFEKRQTLDIADGAADLAQHEIHLILADRDEVFDFVGYMRDHLDRLTQVVAAPLILEHVGIDPARRHAVGAARMHAGEAFVVAKVEIGFCAVIGDEDLAMFKRAHRAGIDVEVGVKLAQPYAIAACLQQRAQSRRGKALAKRRHHTTSDENEPSHSLWEPRAPCW